MTVLENLCKVFLAHLSNFFLCQWAKPSFWLIGLTGVNCVPLADFWKSEVKYSKQGIKQVGFSSNNSWGVVFCHDLSKTKIKQLKKSWEPKNLSDMTLKNSVTPWAVWICTVVAASVTAEMRFLYIHSMFRKIPWPAEWVAVQHQESITPYCVILPLTQIVKTAI